MAVPLLRSIRNAAGILVLLAQPVLAQLPPGPLVDARWLAAHLDSGEVLVIDASPAPLYAKGHLPGAINLDAMTVAAFGVREAPPAELERLFRSRGIDPGKTVVLYDAGGTWLATRLFFALYEAGFPVPRLAILDGGLAKWRQEARPVTEVTATPPAPGSLAVAMRDDARVRLPGLVAGSGDRADKVLLDALPPEYHYGAARFFDRAGHIPHAVLMPAEDFFNPDKTFKSPEEISRLARFLGIGPEREVLAHCGGGGAASVPFFALRFLAGYPRVRLSVDSQLGWLQDDRELPFWTYASPSMMRRGEWLQAWGGKMARGFGFSQVSVIDIRTSEAYERGHLPFSVGVPAEVFRRHASDPTALAAALGAAGVHPGHEAVIVGGAGLTRDAAFAYAVLERLGQQKVSVFVESLESIDTLERLARSDFGLTKDAVKLPPRPYVASTRTSSVAANAPGAPVVYVASGPALPARTLAGKVVHLPAATLVDANGTPRAAGEIWSALAKAGVPRHAHLVTVADDPADAALAYYLLRLMGFASVRAELG